MPLITRDWLVPSSTFQPFLLEDSHLKGGFKIIPDLATRDTRMHPLSLKQGMMIYVEEDQQYYTLDTFDLNTMTIEWGKAKFGGPIDQVAYPLFTDEGVLKLNELQIIPEGGEVGQVLTPDKNGKLTWKDPADNKSRALVEFECPTTLNAQETYEFTLNIGKAALLLKTTLNAPDIEITAYPTASREELNPYKFVSTQELPYDQGIKVSDSGQTNFRRFSFLANLESPETDKIYFRFKNLSTVSVQPKVSLYYLRLQ